MESLRIIFQNIWIHMQKIRKVLSLWTGYYEDGVLYAVYLYTSISGAWMKDLGSHKGSKTPEDDKALGCTVDSAYETRFLTDRHKFNIDIISRYCSAPWSGHSNQPRKTGCYLFLDKINHGWASGLSWSSVIPLCSSTSSSWKYTLDC